jgi:hypothetical protein
MTNPTGAKNAMTRRDYVLIAASLYAKCVQCEEQHKTITTVTKPDCDAQPCDFCGELNCERPVCKRGLEIQDDAGEIWGYNF